MHSTQTHNYTTSALKFEDIIRELTKRKDFLEEKERLRNLPKRKFTMKSFALFVRCAIRFTKALEMMKRGNFELLGALGRKQELKLAAQELSAYEERLQAASQLQVYAHS